MPIYSFQSGRFRLDPAARELRANGVLVTLSPKVFDVLVHLLLHRDRAVGRDELAEAVWGKADVSDDMLGQAVLKARRAVGDAGRRQDVLRTVPRFGYRWVAPVDVEDVPGRSAPPAMHRPDTGADVSASPPPTRVPAKAPAAVARRRRRTALLLFTALLLVAAAIGILWASAV